MFILVLGACAVIQPSYRDERFVIFNRGHFTADEIQRVRAQLEVGTTALEKYIGSVPVRKFPVVVNLWPGRGVSHSHHGQGAIELGYTAANGHWTQEGFASYMQDQYGEDSAFPTQNMAHALVKVLGEEGSLLRWVAYTQSTSFCRYLIERYGSEKFFKLYDAPIEAIDFEGLYGKTAGALVNDWLSYVAALPADTAKARIILHRMKPQPIR